MPKTKTIVTAVIIFLVVTALGIAFDRTTEPSFTFTHNDNTAQASKSIPDNTPAAKDIASDTGLHEPEPSPDEYVINAIDKININTATASQLTALDGVGEVLAGRIVKYREEHGDFSDINQIKNVKGIGSKRFNAIKDMICIK